MCTTPLTNLNIVNTSTRELQADYFCDGSNLPFEYPNWNNDWYSVACREFFKEQLRKPSQSTMNDLYKFIFGAEFGLTPCSPINRYDKKTDS